MFLPQKETKVLQFQEQYKHLKMYLKAVNHFLVLAYPFSVNKIFLIVAINIPYANSNKNKIHIML